MFGSGCENCPEFEVLGGAIFKLDILQTGRKITVLFLFSTAMLKYTYRAPLRRIGKEYSANVAFSIFQSLKRMQPLPIRSKLI
jgi:hypothetical protein